MTSRSGWVFGLAAFAVAAMFLASLTRIDALLPADVLPPPSENLTVERTRVADHLLSLRVRADGSAPMHIAQVMVDSAYWVFTQDKPGALDRGEAAWISIEFPWVANEAHHIRFVTGTGATFDHTIEVALETPIISARLVGSYALLGVFVGVVPIALGMLFFPVLRGSGDRGFEFVLALSVGLLAYLFVDMNLDGLELAEAASPMFGGAALVLIPLAFTFVALNAFSGGSDGPDRSGNRIAGLIALGIGAHNLGEGLAIGAAFATNQAALGAFLIIGFTVHNLTEGLALVAPLVRERAALPLFAALALVAGLPAVPGIWIGAWSMSPHLSAVFFGIGAGAIAQVIIEIDRFSRRRAGAGRFSAVSVSGYATGLAIMYGTALLIAI